MKDILKRIGPYQTIVTSFVVLVASILSGFFVVIPVLRKTWTQFQTFQSLQKETKELAAKASFLESLDSAAVTSDVALVASSLPAEKALASLFTVVEELAIGSGLQISDVTISEGGALSGQAQTKLTPEERQLGGSMIPFVMTADGTPAQIQSFLEEASQARRLIRVRSMTLTYKSESLITARVEMDAFYAPLPTGMGALTQKLEPLSDKETVLLTRLASFPLLGGEEATGGVAPSEGGVVKSNPFAP